MAREYIIKILGWDTYQSRKVKTKTVWLRLQNDFIENPNFSELTSDERIVWLYALCCASKLNNGHVQVPHQCSHRVLNRCTGIDEKTFHRTFEKLKKIRIVEIRTTRGRYADDTSANADVTLRYEDETRRNETLRYADDTRATALEFDFESIYRRYPRKLGKGRGVKKLEKEIRSQEDFQNLIRAVENYGLSRRGQDPQYTKHFSTFTSEWRDWIDYTPEPLPTPDNPAFRRMAGNQYALQQALAAIGGDDEQTG